MTGKKSECAYLQESQEERSEECQPHLSLEEEYGANRAGSHVQSHEGQERMFYSTGLPKTCHA